MKHTLAFIPAALLALALAACGAATPAATSVPAATSTSAPRAAATAAPAQATAIATVASTATQAVPTATAVAPAATTAPATAAATGATLPAIACTAGSTTPASTEGPYYTANSPQKSNLVEPGMAGTVIVVTGRVLDKNCKPVANAWLDFWQADAAGAYDNSGYRLRGHVFTDANGVYRIETVVPGEYPGRTPHIHVKVKATGGNVLTTQLYFPEFNTRNTRDGIYNNKLVVTMLSGTAAKTAAFDFVLP